MIASWRRYNCLPSLSPKAHLVRTLGGSTLDTGSLKLGSLGFHWCFPNCGPSASAQCCLSRYLLRICRQNYGFWAPLCRGNCLGRRFFLEFIFVTRLWGLLAIGLHGSCLWNVSSSAGAKVIPAQRPQYTFGPVHFPCLSSHIDLCTCLKIQVQLEA